VIVGKATTTTHNTTNAIVVGRVMLSDGAMRISEFDMPTSRTVICLIPFTVASCIAFPAFGEEKFSSSVLWSVSSAGDAQMQQFGPIAVRASSGEVLVAAANLQATSERKRELSVVVVSSDGHMLRKHRVFESVGGDAFAAFRSLCFDIISLKDGSVLVFGSQQSDRSYSVWKLSRSGEIQWQKPLGKSLRVCMLYDAMLAPDGSIYVVGSVDRDALVMKLDSEAEELWAKRFSAEETDFGKETKRENGEGDRKPYFQFSEVAASDANGSFVVAGQVSVPSKVGMGRSEVWVLACDPDGHIKGKWGEVGRSPRIASSSSGQRFSILFDESVDQTTSHVLVTLNSKLEEMWRKDVSLGPLLITRPEAGMLGGQKPFVVGAAVDELRFQVFSQSGEVLSTLSQTLNFKSFGMTHICERDSKSWVVLDRLPDSNHPRSTPTSDLLCVETQCTEQ